MKSKTGILVGLAVLAAVFVLWARDSVQASNDLAKQEGVACTSCHDKPGSKLLTDKGKYFEQQRTFEGFDRLEASFDRCTTCHVRKPGSNKLTKKGQSFKDLVTDMDGLREWLLRPHPAVQEAAPTGGSR